MNTSLPLNSKAKPNLLRRERIPFFLQPSKESNGTGIRCGLFFRAATETLRPPAKTFLANAEHWKRFWTEGSAVELARKQKTRRAPEVERRVVLSQYLTAIQLRRLVAATGNRLSR